GRAASRLHAAGAPLPAAARRSALAALLGRVPLLLRRSRPQARGGGELRRDDPDLPRRRPGRPPAGGGRTGRGGRGVPDGPAREGPVQCGLLRGSLRSVAGRPDVGDGAALSPDLTPCRTVTPAYTR